MSKTKASPAFVAATATAKPESKVKNTATVFVDRKTSYYHIEIKIGAKRFTSVAGYSYKKRAETAAAKLAVVLGFEVKL